MQVSATSRTDYAEQAAALGVSFFSDANDFCEEHPDVVILASSILSLDAVLGSLPVQRLRRSTLFVDVLSVKEFPKRLMLSTLPPEVLLCALTLRSQVHRVSSACWTLQAIIASYDTDTCHSALTHVST